MDAPIHSSQIDPAITAFRQKLIEKEDGIDILYREVCTPKASPAPTVWGRVFTATKDAAVEQYHKVAVNLFTLSLKSLQSDLNELFKKDTLTQHQYGLLSQEIQRQTEKVGRIGDALRNIHNPQVRVSEAPKADQQDEPVVKVKSFDELSSAKLQNGEWEQTVETNTFFYQSFKGYLNYLKDLFMQDHGNSFVTFNKGYLLHLFCLKIAIQRSLELTTHQKNELVNNLHGYLWTYVVSDLSSRVANLSREDKEFAINFAVKNLLNVDFNLDLKLQGNIRYHVYEYSGKISGGNKDLIKSFQTTLLYFEAVQRQDIQDSEFEFSNNI